MSLRKTMRGRKGIEILANNEGEGTAQMGKEGDKRGEMCIG
jgi:hypothetical protein